MTPLCSTCRHRKVQSLGVDRRTWSYPYCDHPSVSQADPVLARSSTGDCGPDGAFHEAMAADIGRGMIAPLWLHVSTDGQVTGPLSDEYARALAEYELPSIPNTEGQQP